MSIYLSDTNAQVQVGTDQDGFAMYSKWAAAFNPIKFKLRRIDFFCSIVKDITLDPVRAVAIVTVTLPNPLFGLLAVDSYVYIEAPLYKGAFKVVAISGAKIVLDTAWIGNNSTVPINLTGATKNYYIETEIGIIENSTFISLGKSINRPFSDGRVTVQPQNWLRSKLGLESTNDYTLVNNVDSKASSKYSLKVREVWEQQLEPQAQANFGALYVAASALQIQTNWDGNLGDYTPQIATNQSEEQKARFLSDFKKPTYFPGYPFDLGFIYSEVIAPFLCKRVVQEFDLNGGASSEASTDLDDAYREHVNSLTLPSLSGTAREIDVWIDCDLDTAAPGHTAWADPDYAGEAYSTYSDTYPTTSIPAEV